MTDLPDIAYAHTKAGEPLEAWEPLEQHLVNVAELASRFASAFDSGDWGRLAGLWHDLGKFQPEFQARLRGAAEHIEHAGIGALVAAEKQQPGCHNLAFVIAGHHAGLANRDAQGDSALSPLTRRLASNRPVMEKLRPALPATLTSQALPPPPAFLKTSAEPSAVRRWELWTRMLFSALVDADRLATERFDNEAKAARRSSPFPTVADLVKRLNVHLATLPVGGPMRDARLRVLADCRRAAEWEPGFFSLTAPTGTGKTLSAMAFALAHAEAFHLRRVIVVVPYTTIIEQNAAVYRKAFGDEAVIEHHASIDTESRLETYGEAERRRQMAAENWDAPIIVTTNVQFFESLLSNHPSQCRKIHNVARSVIVLDEAQTLPAGYLACLLDVMKALVSDYSSTIVLATATQPALNKRESLPAGFEGVREITRDTADLARTMARVTITWPAADEPPLDYQSLAEGIGRHPQVLAVVHLRNDARQVAQLLPPDGRFHLSALMCASHRAQVLARVKAALSEGQACRLVATQLIEAGVDVDFPVVFRALAGLDSLAQAAGRCNREWRADRGEFRVFRANTAPPRGILRTGLELVEGMLKSRDHRLDLTDVVLYQEYFRMLYHAADTDRRHVQAEREQFNFANVDAKVRLVEDGYRRAVVVPWDDAMDRVNALRSNPHRAALRRLQPFLVQVNDADVRRLEQDGAVEQLNENLWCMTTPFRRLYDREFGMSTGDAGADPAELIV